jgi:hypothetical protein
MDGGAIELAKWMDSQKPALEAVGSEREPNASDPWEHHELLYSGCSYPLSKPSTRLFIYLNLSCCNCILLGGGGGGGDIRMAQLLESTRSKLLLQPNRNVGFEFQLLDWERGGGGTNL